MRSSKAPTSNSRRKRGGSFCSTRSACSQTATAGSVRSPRTSRWTRPIGERTMILPAIFFYFFAGTCFAAAFMVIASRNPVHSVLFLILAFVNAAGLFVLLGAEFLAMILILVCFGAVRVFFRFVVWLVE